jgi:hypothetical protein
MVLMQTFSAACMKTRQNGDNFNLNEIAPFRKTNGTLVILTKRIQSQLFIVLF